MSAMRWARVRLPAQILAIFFCAAAIPQANSEVAIGNEHSTWREYGGGPSQVQYSSLDQVNRDNVHDLEVAWVYDSGDVDSEEREYHAKRRLHHTPIVLGDLIYGVSPALRVFALNAATGELAWEREPTLAPGEKSLGGVFIRGLMQWQGRRILYTAGHYLYALDAATGEPVSGFGESGRVDLREGLGRPVDSVGISATSPGVVFEDLVIMGSSLSESLPAAPGDVRAFDVHTGELRWSFHTIPHPGEYGHETWPEDAWTYSGGANAWSGMSLDRERGIVFFGTGSASDDFYGANRHGDNLFANSVVALDARTGKREWHFQVVRHDAWDRDLPAPPVLATVNRDGEPVDAVIQVTKSGHVFVLDRDSGQSLFPLEEVPVEPSTLPGEQLAKTQRLPKLPAPFSRQVFDETTITDRSPEATANVREQLKEITIGGQFIPPSTRAQAVFPGFDGGAEWGGPAFDPETSLLYVNANEMPWLLKLEERQPLPAGAHASQAYQLLCSSCHGDDRQGTGEFPSLVGLDERMDWEGFTDVLMSGRGRMPAFSAWFDWKGRDAMAAYLLHGQDGPIETALGADSPLFLRYRIAGYPLFTDHEGYPAVKPPWGTLSAINMDTGEYAWQIPLGQYPELVAQGLDDTGSQNYGGPVVTAGGLVFIAATLFDRKIRAFDKASGKLLWEHELPAAGVATPAVYQADGRQFIVIAAGGGKFGGKQSGKYVAFALPEKD
ncbi:PQQ-binding-like beta-propeller repeat protein [Marinihelvus fidelis]|uniref:PQQ-binding-like beta-propeller repeat protein n=1 Tax=Marinihelvus fidelis TaxID=2613842 RepID=A0A5N0T6K8_9GAMM|nr:PQQ-binding-like beta-propeller repeat protein [Marinihelvus fidelis]KAA9130502.1 PQQ-binding-like beta-propeller repeat protein [Marinihelvus fidelis]